MRARLPGLLAVLALLCVAFPVAAGAAVKANVKRVIKDYRNDGRIDPCRHSAKDLRDTLKAISADTEQYAPDFPAAVEAALEARARGECDKKKKSSGGDGAGGGTVAGGTGGTPAPPPAPAPPAGGAIGDVVPAPPAPPPAPSVSSAPPGGGAAITPGVPAPRTNKPDVALTRSGSGSDAAEAPLIVLAALLAACLLAGLGLLAMRRFGWGEERLAGARHAWAEAGFRTGGTWHDFTDWVRLGR